MNAAVWLLFVILAILMWAATSLLYKAGVHGGDEEHITLKYSVCIGIVFFVIAAAYLVIREEGGKRVTYEVNLLDQASVFNSPAYYLQQNDVVYVRPNKSQRVKGSTSYTWLTVGSTVVGMVVSVVSLIVALKK